MSPHAAGEQALDRLRLLGDFLGHEVGVAAERGRRGVPVDVYGRGNVDLGALGVEDRDPPPLLQPSELAVLKLDDMRGDACERRDVRGGIRPLRGRGDHERGPVPRAHNLARRVGAHHGKRPRALEAAHRVADGPHEVAGGGTRPSVLDEVGDYLGVGLGDERVTTSLQIRPQLAVVLDDAVVNDGDAPAAVPVRMGVAVGRRPVRRPARMRDARRPDEVGRLAALDERGDTARALDAVQGAVGPQHRDARGVISPIL